MWNNIDYDRCLSFINCQLNPLANEPAGSELRPAVTISRPSGAGGHTVASLLAEYLQARLPGHVAWTVFDRNLVERVIEDHHLSKQVAQYLSEGHKSYLADIFEELFGLHPSSWTLVHQTAETIVHLARLGNVILVGRAANIVTASLDNVFHVRLVGSLARRLRRVQEVHHLTPAAAVEYVKREDRARRDYVKDNYHKDCDDPLLYHLVLNTDRVPYAEAAEMIGDEVVRRFNARFRTQAVAA